MPAGGMSTKPGGKCIAHRSGSSTGGVKTATWSGRARRCRWNGRGGATGGAGRWRWNATGGFRTRQRDVARRVLAGVSTRPYGRVLDDLCDGYGISQSAVSRQWRAASAEALRGLCERPLGDLDRP